MYLIPSWWQETMDPKALLLTGLRENDFLGVSPTWHLSWREFFLIRCIFALWYDIPKTFWQEFIQNVGTWRPRCDSPKQICSLIRYPLTFLLEWESWMLLTVFVTIWVWIWHGNWLVKGWWNGSMAMINEIWMNSQSASPATLVALK